MDRKIIISQIRNINYMEFKLPGEGVHIITGENGVGKTTLFTCLSRICNNNAYRTGFLTTNLSNYDKYMGSISYFVGAVRGSGLCPHVPGGHCPCRSPAHRG